MHELSALADSQKLKLKLELQRRQEATEQSLTA